MWVLGWQTKAIVYYEKQYSKALKMEVEEVDRCIQALIDAKILCTRYIDERWILEPVAETFQRFYEVPISKVIESGKTLEMADKVTWNKETTTTQSNDVDDMSEDEMKRMLLMLQARLKEKQEVKKLVVSNDVVDDLLW